jgi:predicted nucleic acid-binding protein
MDNPVVVDTSVVMSWCFEDETNPYADAVLDHLSRATAIVPAIWTLEVVNVLLVAERRKRLKPADSVRFLSLLSQLPIVVENTRAENSMKDLLALGRSGRLSSYDAAYLDLAMRIRCPLATLDKEMIEASIAIDVSIF